MADRTETTHTAVQILERGNVYFLYRPAIGQEEPQGLADVGRFHLVLSPEGSRRLRLLTVGRKRLPEPDDQGQRFWGFVARVVDDPEPLRALLAAHRVETAQGYQALPAARPAGEGVYAIAAHGNHVHLLYALELPQEPAEVQEELQIRKQGSYLLSVKNPEAGSPPGVGLEPERKAEFPPDLQERFAGRRFLACDPPAFLDHEGAELLLMGTSEPAEELLAAVDLTPQRETLATADLLRELGLDREEQPLEPLLEGSWA